MFVDSGADVAPLIEAVERWGVTPVALLRTHGHHDHVVNEDELARRYSIPVLAEPGEWKWDGLRVRALATPGHSDDGLSFVFDDGIVATGDTLFRDAVGGGDVEAVRRSVMDVLLAAARRHARPAGAHRRDDDRARAPRRTRSSASGAARRRRERERVRVGGRDATLIVWSPDYDGNGKAWVRFDDGEEATVGGSRVERG